MNENNDWTKDFKVIAIGNADRVICDQCGKDWTDSKTSGGFLFVSNAICPDCAENYMKGIKEYNEEHFIRSKCPGNVSFYSYIMTMRKDDGI